MKTLIFVGKAHDPVGGAAHHAVTLFTRPKCLELEVLEAAERVSRARRVRGDSPIDWANVIEIDEIMQSTKTSSWSIAFADCDATLKRRGAVKVRRCSNGEFVGLFPQTTVNMQLGRAIRAIAAGGSWLQGSLAPASV